MHTSTTNDVSFVSFTHGLPTFSPYLSRLDEIELELENIYAHEKYLSYISRLKIEGMQAQMDKILTKYQNGDRELTPLDMLRLTSFQERIDAIYLENEPSSEDFLRAETLLLEKEKLLNL